MRKQFKKYDRLALLNEMNEEHSEGITLFVQHLEDEKEVIVGKLKSVDRLGADFLGIERDGEVYEIRHSFPKMMYSTEEVKKYLASIIEIIS
ncbi:MAG: DUF2470 domain-containing protein [Bacteroidota bacterium]